MAAIADGPTPGSPADLGREADADRPTPGSPADLGHEADAESVARAIVLRKLTAAPRTRAQLADDLRRRNVPADVRERVLDRFGEVGLVDDASFAAAWVRSRHCGRGLAGSVLRHELAMRGVDRGIVDQALAGVTPDEEGETARALVAKKLPSTRGLTGERRTRRLVAMLARKGYPPELAASIVREALSTEA